MTAIAEDSVTGEERRYSVVFDPVPTGSSYRIAGKAPGFSGLAWSSLVVELMQPDEIPLDFIRFLLENDSISFEQMLYKSAKAQPTVTLFAFIGLVLAGVLPVVALFVCVFSWVGGCNGGKKSEGQGCCFYCARKVFGILLATFLLLLMLSFVAVIFSNEKVNTSMGTVKEDIGDSVRDMTTYFRNSEIQLKFIITNSLEQTIGAVISDLDDVEYLFGRPLQRELSEEAGVDTAISSLLEISRDLRHISKKMKTFDIFREQALTRQLEAIYRLKALRKDLELLISSCSFDDRLLCQTLNSSGLEMEGSFLSFSFSGHLSRLTDGGFHNMTEAARKARYQFDNIPILVSSLTQNSREEVKEALRKLEAEVIIKVKNLELLTSDLEKKMNELLNSIGKVVDLVVRWEHTRWLIGIGAVSCLGVVVLIMLVGECFGCCFQKDHEEPNERNCGSNLGGRILLCGVSVMFILSSVLWVICVSVLVVGGHAHGLICRPLNEKPDYQGITALLDANGVFFPEQGFWSYFLSKESELKIKNILNRCEEGETAYKVFRIEELLNVKKDLNFGSNSSFEAALAKIDVNLTRLELISPQSEEQILKFLQIVELDITPFRKLVQQPMVTTDIPTLTKQIETVAAALHSHETSAKMFRLVSKLRDFMTNIYYPLQRRKEDLTYQLATLDVEIVPLHQRVKESSLQIRRSQNYIYEKSSLLLSEKQQQYIQSLAQHGYRYSEYVHDEVLNEVAKCSPIWNSFVFAKNVVCGNIVDQLNTLWIALFVSLMLYLPTSFIAVKLSRYYLRMDSDSDSSGINDVISKHDSNSIRRSSVVTPNNLWVTSGSQALPPHIPKTYSPTHLPHEPYDTPNHQNESNYYSDHRETNDADQEHLDRAQEQGTHWQAQDVTYDNVASIRYPPCTNPEHYQSSAVLPPQPHIIPRFQRISRYDDSPSLPPRNMSGHRYPDLPSKQRDSFIPRVSTSGLMVNDWHHNREIPRQTSYLHSSRYCPRIQKRHPTIVETNENGVHHRERRGTPSSQDEFAEWQGTSSDVVAAAQITAWRDAARAGANFVTPEIIAAHIKKTPKWVRSFWHTDPRLLAKNLMRSAPAPHPQPQTHALRMLCGGRVSKD